ncbi:MAG: Ig-like domain-containing protein [Prevotella sp.]|nr:Ig-like domain-containing protein [Prevotella sp.]
MKKLIYIFCITLLIMGCARMGQPDGGWYDDDPPRVIGSSPADRGTNVKSKKVAIYFDEFIKIEDATNKVIVSPPQLETPEIKGAGKKILVELKDSLMENTTYTIDFSDAITDNNEGNPMGNYTFTFSTGEEIDTFEIAGYVLDASNLEPIKGIQVGLYKDLADSAFKTKPMLRVSRTDSRGHFVVKGVAPGTYRAYAVQDMDGDFHFTQKGEMIAFNHETYVPSSKPDTRTDTIWRDSLHIDALRQVPYTHFLPDDITLLAFTHLQTDRMLLKQERVEPNKFSMYFTYGDSLLPQIKGLNFDADSAFVVESSEKGDTVHFWLRDTTLVNQDTLRMVINYQVTDSLGRLEMFEDTTEVVSKVLYEKRLKEQNKALEKWQKEQDKKKKNGEKYDSIYPVKPLEVNYRIPSAPEPGAHGFIEMPTPLAVCDTSKIHLYSMIDSVWYQSPFVFQPLRNSVRTYEVVADWRLDTEYSFEVDSAAFIDIYGLVADANKIGIKVKNKDEYSSLKVSVSGVDAVDTTIIVQLLSASDEVERAVRVRKGVATFDYLNPGKYYMRAFIDANGNGVWDTGDYDADRQAEAVYYYTKQIECKEKWDISESWNMTATERFRQKPGAITKQKPDQAKKLKNRNIERAEKLGKQYLKTQGVNLK